MAGIAGGRLAASGLLEPEDCATAEELLARLDGSEIETVRVVFIDQHGILRGKTLMPEALPSLFRSGIAAPSTLLLKDTSHRTVFPVWSKDAGIASGPMQGANDMLLVPDPGSLTPLPWSPHSAWLFARPVHRSGAPIPFAPETVLRTAIDRLADQGYAAKLGLEVEFHVLDVTDDALDHDQTTMPGQPPQTRALTQGYQFLTDARYGEAEEVLDLIRRNAQGLGLPIRSLEIEMGPSQFEATFAPADPMTAARRMVMFRAMVKEVCARQGLHATFMARPRLPNITASGWHIHQSLEDLGTGANLFTPEGAHELTVEAAGWIAGLLAHAAESQLLIAPTVNSYKRYSGQQLAPDRVQWGWDNRGAMVRALLAPGDGASRLENRAPDATANPCYAIAAQLLSGLSGLTEGLEPPAPCETPYDSDVPPLPKSLRDAVEAFVGSALYRDVLGDETVDYLARLKRAEWDRYVATVSEWEQAEYFGLF
ncbi:MAG: glutamine synthetase [Rhodobacteraceae bacterium]|nr:MAG: glutamine synthetase [Paracoccaceae bacterium]